MKDREELPNLAMGGKGWKLEVWGSPGKSGNRQINLRG